MGLVNWGLGADVIEREVCCSQGEQTLKMVKILLVSEKFNGPSKKSVREVNVRCARTIIVPIIVQNAVRYFHFQIHTRLKRPVQVNNN